MTVLNDPTTRRTRKRLLVAVAVAAIAVLLLVVAFRRGNDEPARTEETTHQDQTTMSEIVLTPGTMKAAGIEVVSVTRSTSTLPLRVTGTIEANQQQIQQVTPLVSGRVDQVFAALGDSVQKGSILAIVSSPEVAEMHGKLLEAESHLNLAEANLRRTERLSELGAAAGKDLVASRSEAEIARFDVAHLRDALRTVSALPERGKHNIAAVALRSPISGVVTERTVNPGAGVEPGKQLFTIANLSTVWVIANVPESQISALRAGAPAEVRPAALGNTVLTGRVSYIDPLLNESTRTVRVRIDVRNPANQLKLGMFATVTLQSMLLRPASAVNVPEDAIQRLEEKDVVFVEKGGEGKFEVREVALGDKVEGQRQVLRGLAPGERVVAKGSFVLKSQLLKSQFAEED